MGEFREIRCRCGALVRIPIPPRINPKEYELKRAIADAESRLAAAEKLAIRASDKLGHTLACPDDCLKCELREFTRAAVVEGE